MTQNGDPYEIAIAERVDGILKLNSSAVIMTPLIMSLNILQEALPFTIIKEGTAV
ncbi:MAG: hypothetical protein ABIN97_04225 [Ginsengibacter sp.]